MRGKKEAVVQVGDIVDLHRHKFRPRDFTAPLVATPNEAELLCKALSVFRSNGRGKVLAFEAKYDD